MNRATEETGLSGPAPQDGGKRARPLTQRGSGVKGRRVQGNLKQTDHTRGSIGPAGDRLSLVSHRGEAIGRIGGLRSWRARVRTFSFKGS